MDRIASETEAIINDMMPDPHRQHSLTAPDLDQPATWETPVLSLVSGYIRYVDTRHLVELAKTYHVKLHVVRRVGHFVPEDTPIRWRTKASGCPRMVSTTCGTLSTLVRPERCSRMSNSGITDRGYRAQGYLTSR